MDGVRGGSVAVVLAAGLGTRMRSSLPKALHPLAGRPMLAHLLETCGRVFERIVVVVGPEMEAVARVAAPHAVAVQGERCGTAHAALAAAGHFGNGELAVLFADNPLIGAETLRALLDRRVQAGAGLALMTMRPVDPGRYGRVVTEGGRVQRIVEWKDATEAERAISLCNAGAMAGEAGRMLAWLRKVRADNAAREFYLTDLVSLANRDGAGVVAAEGDERELRGINSRAELAVAEAEVQAALRARAMEAGASLVAPDTVFFSWDTVLEPDTSVEPHVVFGPGVQVATGARVRAFSHLEGARIGAGAVVGPYARLRPGTVVGAGAHVGNFVELKAAMLGEGAKANHLSYIGDAAVGAGTNIGAGTITCNYDGYAKYRTVIGEKAFVGSDSVLVAPVAIGDGAFVAAGSVITADVAPDAMAFGRARQHVVPEGGAKFRTRKGGG